MRDLLIPFVLAAAVAGQTPQPADTAAPVFEVASVRPNRSGAPGGSFVMPPGRFTATNIPLKVIIAGIRAGPGLRPQCLAFSLAHP